MEVYELKKDYRKFEYTPVILFPFNLQKKIFHSEAFRTMFLARNEIFFLSFILKIVLEGKWYKNITIYRHFIYRNFEIFNYLTFSGFKIRINGSFICADYKLHFYNTLIQMRFDCFDDKTAILANENHFVLQYISKIFFMENKVYTKD